MGGSPSTTTQIVKQEIPEWAKPYYESVGRRGMSESGRRYQPYGGERIAGFAPQEQRAFGAAEGMFAAGPRPELAESQAYTSEAFRRASTPGQWNAQAFDQYANPYRTRVLDLQKERMRRDYQDMIARSGRDISRQFADSGIYGGRASVMGAKAAGEIAREFSDNMRMLDAEGLASMYDSAQESFRADRDARQASIAYQLEAARQQQALAQVQQDQARQRMDTLSLLGVKQREMDQAMRDQAYADFLSQRDWNKEQLNWFTGLLSGTPYASTNRAQITTAPGASPISQGVGLGMAGLGAYKAFTS